MLLVDGGAAVLEAALLGPGQTKGRSMSFSVIHMWCDQLLLLTDAC